MLLPDLDFVEVEKALCALSLSEFVQCAWPIIEPADKYVHGWHVEAICEHLEAITKGDINRLLINIPPGTMKSTLSSVFWPAWEWGPKGMASMRFIGASHEAGLATRDAMKMRRLIDSDWYQARWPTRMHRDQNEKTYFENANTGFRQAVAVKSMTGRRGHRIVWDDPHSVEAALSEADRLTAIRVFKETLPTRLVNPETSAIVIVMQRLHEEDVSGLILGNDFGYTHLCLPMEFEADRCCVTSIGFVDPRKEEGELLFPERFPREVVDRDKKVMGSMAVAGQFQQRPSPRGGGMFDWGKIEIVKVAPALTKVVRYWDKAGTEDGGAWTAGVKMGVSREGKYYILDVVRGQWGAAKRERNMKAVAPLDGIATDIWIEQEPGSGGKESAENTVINLAGYTIRAERPTGDKAVRANPFSIQVEAGNVCIVEGDWNEEYIKELQTFPVGKYKDQVDASSGAFNKLAVPSLLGIALPSRHQGR